MCWEWFSITLFNLDVTQVARGYVNIEYRWTILLPGDTLVHVERFDSVLEITKAPIFYQSSGVPTWSFCPITSGIPPWWIELDTPRCRFSRKFHVRNPTPLSYGTCSLVPQEKAGVDERVAFSGVSPAAFDTDRGVSYPSVQLDGTISVRVSFASCGDGWA